MNYCFSLKRLTSNSRSVIDLTDISYELFCKNFSVNTVIAIQVRSMETNKLTCLEQEPN